MFYVVCCSFKFLDNTIARFLSKRFILMELGYGETARGNVRPLADPGWGWHAKPARVSSSITKEIKSDLDTANLNLTFPPTSSVCPGDWRLVSRPKSATHQHFGDGACCQCPVLKLS